MPGTETASVEIPADDEDEEASGGKICILQAGLGGWVWHLKTLSGESIQFGYGAIPVYKGIARDALRLLVLLLLTSVYQDVPGVSPASQEWATANWSELTKKLATHL